MGGHSRQPSLEEDTRVVLWVPWKMHLRFFSLEERVSERVVAEPPFASICSCWLHRPPSRHQDGPTSTSCQLRTDACLKRKVHLIASLETQPQLVRALYLPVPSKLVAHSVAEGDAIVIGDGSRRTS